jgi:tetraacyldisaccharide 4'-kinase
LILTAATSIYGAAARQRRRWYAGHPSRQRHLSRPVVSVGNLRVGGAGKTPIVAAIARLLMARGERPAILTRGYAREAASDGVTVVSDGVAVLAGVETAGDEALMLARELAGVPVLVGADRYLSGRLAERQFGATVLLLDDGFQHLPLARDADLLVVDQDDLSDRVLPAGRLREPLTSARLADAVLVNAGDEAAAAGVGRSLGVTTAFFVTRTLSAPRLIATDEPAAVVPTGAPVFAVAGIARPERFFSNLAAAGWHVAGTRAFGDHHPFTQRDVDRIAAQAGTAGAAIVLTTAKDGVRLSTCNLAGLQVAIVPLVVSIEPRDSFALWLHDRVRESAGAHIRDVPA